MKRNGFTLIELLAVIVILAIIALIATPIILGIIKDAREESNERSVELYAAAVRNGIAAHQLTGSEVPSGTYSLTADKTSLTNGTVTFDVDYDGNVECTTITITEDGEVTLAGCKVNGEDKVYSYGTEEDETPDNEDIPEVEEPTVQDYEPDFYYFGFDWNGSIEQVAPDYSERLTTPPTGQRFFLGYDVPNNSISNAYVCFYRNDIKWCLKNNDYDKSIAILNAAFSDVADTACFYGDGDYSCNDDGLYVFAYEWGDVRALIDYTGCVVEGDGDFNCYQN